MPALPEQWLLLRGLTRERRHWFGFAETFSRQLGRRVVALDLPGVGTESHRRSPSSVRSIALDVRQRLRRGIPLANGTWGVLGVSLGGMVALQLAALEGLRCSHLVIVNASSRLSNPSERLRPTAFWTFLKAARVKSPLRRELGIYEVTSSLRAAERRRYAELSAGFLASAPVRRATALRQLVAATRFCAPPSLPQNLLVLTSAGDRVVSARCSRQLADYYRAPYAEHPSAGHELTLDDPDWVLQQVTAWLPRTP